MFDIRSLQIGEEKHCEAILRSLPEWFGIESARAQYVKDIASMKSWLAWSGVGVAGFVTVNRHNECTTEVHVMGVRPEFHRQGLGALLIKLVEDYSIREGFEYLIVKTLSPKREDVHYEKTRQFYLKAGFKPVQEFPEIWGEENPCLLMLKVLQ